MLAHDAVAMFYPAADAGWAACLMVDLRARGMTIWDTGAVDCDRAAVAGRCAGIVVVHSWHRPQRGPSDTEIASIRSIGRPVVVVRRNGTKLAVDDYPGRSAELALWGDYYQPAVSRDSALHGGFANLLNVFGLTAPLPLTNYVFISYHADGDREFVQEQVRPALALAGYPSWDYRMSERIADNAVAERLHARIEAASALLVVATARWWTRWTALEVDIARRVGKPVFGVRPADVRPSRRAVLSSLEVHVIDPFDVTAPLLVSDLERSGIEPLVGG